MNPELNVMKLDRRGREAFLAEADREGIVFVSDFWDMIFNSVHRLLTDEVPAEDIREGLVGMLWDLRHLMLLSPLDRSQAIYFGTCMIDQAIEAVSEQMEDWT